ncbi:hypothetical protein [Nonomuraea jiangxiensis]|uniref:Small secreted hydrophilic protein n=1 Tax=Nonomuraea jiangxiensis TaxID=633440 RepID=A0A1G8ULV6_9ACTN|nr:hypothetical protein [Nonomuraea jiangxiensis]SDJ54477.1 hypothetical protein SAMN05421869_11123 [Nonomuraea jiangxiensis]
MKRRVAVIFLLLGAVTAGFAAMELVRAVDNGPNLGKPVVVSPSSDEGGLDTRPPSTQPVGDSRSRAPGEGQSLSPGQGRSPADDRSPASTVEPTPSGSAEPSARPTPRKTKAEPVKPPSPRPAGGDDDDDDDGGADDDDGDGDDDD